MSGNSSLSCQPLKTSDLGAYRLCLEWQRHRLPLEALDRGVSQLDFADARRPRRFLSGAGDRFLSGPEIYQGFLAQAESDQVRPEARTASGKFLNLLKAKAGLRIPWIFEDGNPLTRADLQFYRLSRKKIVEFRSR